MRNCNCRRRCNSNCNCRRQNCSMNSCNMCNNNSNCNCMNHNENHSNCNCMNHNDNNYNCRCANNNEYTNSNPFPCNYLYGHAYTPNQTINELFDPQTGLDNGSMFPELVSPYYPGQSMEFIEYLKTTGRNGGCGCE